MMRTFFAAALLLLGGCAASAQATRAYVNVNALVRVHPLYGTLAQYDRQIAALQGTLRTRFANTDLAVAHAQSAVSNDANADAIAYRDAVSRTATCCAPPPAPAPATAPSDIAQQMTQTYDTQRAEVRSAASDELQSYRTALQSQESQASSTFAQSVSDRAQRAVQQRAQELREQEANLALELARQHAAQRLQLRSKLTTLVLRDDVRAGLRAQLAALNAQESAALAAARRSDSAKLQAYTAQTQARAQSDLAQMQSDLARRSAANLSARERVTSAQQSSSSASLPLTTDAPPTTKPVNLNAQIAALQHDALPSDAAFAAVRTSLVSQWDGLRTANRDDTTHTQSQIAWLRHDREMVRKKIVAQILYQAQQVAKARGLEGVATTPAPGVTDVTPAVREYLASLNAL